MLFRAVVTGDQLVLGNQKTRRSSGSMGLLCKSCLKGTTLGSGGLIFRHRLCDQQHCGDETHKMCGEGQVRLLANVFSDSKKDHGSDDAAGIEARRERQPSHQTEDQKRGKADAVPWTGLG